MRKKGSKKNTITVRIVDKQGAGGFGGGINSASRISNGGRSPTKEKARRDNSQQAIFGNNFNLIAVRGAETHTLSFIYFGNL